MLENILSTVTAKYGAPRPIELGKIKVGGLGQERTSARGTKWRQPEKYDHFVVTTLTRNDEGRLINDGELMQTLVRDHGDRDGKVRQIPIRILSDELEDVLQARFVWYGKKSAGAVSDGQTVTWYYELGTMKPLNPPRVEDWRPEMLDLCLPGTENPIFKLHANFNCVIACGDSRFGGVYKFRTTSIISFKQLYASLLHISQLTGGVLVGMPLMMCVRPMLVKPKDSPTTVYVVHCELRGKDMQQIQTIALDQARFRLQFAGDLQKVQRQYRALLTAPGDEAELEAGDIAEEFQPEEHSEDSTVLDGAVVNKAASETTLNDRLAGDVGKRQTQPRKTNAPKPAQEQRQQHQETVPQQETVPENDQHQDEEHGQQFDESEAPATDQQANERPHKEPQGNGDNGHTNGNGADDSPASEEVNALLSRINQARAQADLTAVQAEAATLWNEGLLNESQKDHIELRCNVKLNQIRAQLRGGPRR